MPVDRGVLDAQLREIGEGERWWELGEFRALPHVLHAGETILGLVEGRVLGARGPRLRPAGRWLLVATDQRLLCLKQERFARRQLELTPGQITRVSRRSRLGGYQVTLATPQGRYRIRLPKNEAHRFNAMLAAFAPDLAGHGVSPAAGPWAWLADGPGAASLPGVGRLVSRVAGPQPAAREEVERLEATVERLQADVERLQQQVGFLEELLERRVEEAYLPRSAADARPRR